MASAARTSSHLVPSLIRRRRSGDRTGVSRAPRHRAAGDKIGGDYGVFTVDQTVTHEGVGSYFLDTVDRPKRGSGCECERSSGATLAQVLLLANSDELENKLADGKGRIAKLMTDKKPIPEMIDSIYLSAYARLPSDQELSTTVGYVEAQENKQQALEDVLWTVINSKEFLFNH